jgi:signal transduction histidine kinase
LSPKTSKEVATDPTLTNMQPNYHGLLLQQIQENIGSYADLSEPLRTLLQVVSSSYAKFDEALKAAEATSALRTDQLIASTSRAYSFLDSIHKGFIMCDTSGEVVLTNNSLRYILSLKNATADSTESPQVPNGELSVDALSELFHPELKLKELIKQCLATSQPLEQEEINFGKRVLKLYFAPLLNEPGTSNQQLLGVVILVEDITEEKVLERSKDDFLSIASHELRTPLTAIRGNSSLIKKHYSAAITDQSLNEMIDDIHEASVRLIGIVNDFLDVAAIEQGKIRMQPEVFSLQEIIDEVVRELHQLCADRGITLVSDPSVFTAPAVLADKQRIKQVIINLVGNAIKFTDEGSITISIWADDNFVHTVVTDTGKGMSEESQKLLFRKFQQAGSSLLTRDTTKGTGLGLYISKLIVELSGGKIGLQNSTLKAGSSFAFSLPRAK